ILQHAAQGIRRRLVEPVAPAGRTDKHSGETSMEPPAGPPHMRSMKIGIIGSGRMGRALGLGWARAGHDVLFGSRDAGKAAALAAEAGGRSGSFDDAAAFGEAVLYSVREVGPSKLLRAPRALAGKVLIDCNNSGVLGLDVPDPARAGIHFPP